MSHLLSPACTIVRAADAIFRDKGTGTKVSYYIFPEYEIHANTIDPHSVQEWHHHQRIVETLFVVHGTLEVRWLDEGVQRAEVLLPGDLIEVGGAAHTVANPSNEPAEFLVFRFVPDGTDKRELIKGDRFADPEPTL